jgi:Tol biopolymer transport system component
MEQAIELYERLTVEFPLDRSLTARGLLLLGDAYEKIGRSGAREAYRRVVDDFADQPDEHRMARGRLAVLFALSRQRSGSAGADPTLTFLLEHLVVSNPGYPAPYDVSPDGRQLVFRDHAPGQRPPGLYISDRGGTAVRPLITLDPEHGPTEGLWSPRWSPDGRRIAFTARFPQQDRVLGLYVIDVNGGEPRRLGDSFTDHLCWNPDGTSVTHVGDADGRLHVQSVTDPETEVTLGDPLPRATLLGGYSPDGEWLALDIRTERFGREMRDVWVMATSDGERFHVTDAPGTDSNPTWGPDGSLYFVSDRSGSANIWTLESHAITGGRRPPGRMRPGTRRGQVGRARDEEPGVAAPDQVTFFTDVRVRYPRLVGAGEAIAFVAQSVTNTIRVADAARPDQSRPLAQGRHPQLSPRGDRVYFEGEGRLPEGLYVVTRTGGAPVRLVGGPLPGASRMPRFQLSPRGEAIAYVGRADGRRTLLVVSSTGGTPRTVADLPGEDPTLPVWSPDGERIAFTSGPGLHVVSRDGGLSTTVAELAGWDGWSVRWSPDGARLAALGWMGADGERNHVFVVPAAGGDLRQLTPNAEREYKEGLEWHPDGRAIVYKYYRPGGDGDGLRTVPVEGGPTSVFIDEPATWDDVGRWAPDGSGFFFVASDGDRPGWQLYRSDSGTREVSEVSAGDDIGLPTWSGDGSTVAWSVERVVSQLWLMEDLR